MIAVLLILIVFLCINSYMTETFTSHNSIYIRRGIPHHKNFGDEINKDFFAYFTQKNVIMNSNQASILGIGSIIRLLRDGDIVYGSGLITPLSLDYKIAKPHKIIATRGPLTRDELLKQGIDCPKLYGDPAILLPFWIPIPKIKKKYKLGIIPHYVDQNNAMLNKYRDNSEVLLIDIKSGNDPEGFISKVCSCEYIVSSSLHGIIVADAYNIPSGHMKLSDRVVGDTFKFRDYYSSCGREYYHVKMGGSIYSIISQLKPYKCRFNLRRLIMEFPEIDQIIKNRCLNMLDKGYLKHLQ